MRVHLEADVCQRHTLCALAAPEVFLLREEDGDSYVAQEGVPPGLEEAVRKAVATYPEGAISIEE